MLAAARVLKETQSASTSAQVVVEELLPSWDFTLVVTRDEADEACKDIYEAFAINNPVRSLRENGYLQNITVRNLEYERKKKNHLSLILTNNDRVIGGASRLPKVLAILAAEGHPMARHLSADESVVWGAAEYGRLLYAKGIELEDALPPPPFPDQRRLLNTEEREALTNVMQAHKRRELLKQLKEEARKRLESVLEKARETDLADQEVLQSVSAWLDDTTAATEVKEYEEKIVEMDKMLHKAKRDEL